MKHATSQQDTEDLRQALRIADDRLRRERRNRRVFLIFLAILAISISAFTGYCSAGGLK